MSDRNDAMFLSGAMSWLEYIAIVAGGVPRSLFAPAKREASKLTQFQAHGLQRPA